MRKICVRGEYLHDCRTIDSKRNSKNYLSLHGDSIKMRWT